MGGFETKTLIEPVRRNPGPVRRELDQFCTASAPFRDRPCDHRPSKAVAAKIGTDADRFNLQSRSSGSGESGNECQLHGPNNRILGRDDGDKKLGRIGVNCSEGKFVGMPVLDRNRLDRSPELVGRQKRNDGPEIRFISTPNSEWAARQLQFSESHFPSIPQR